MKDLKMNTKNIITAKMIKSASMAALKKARMYNTNLIVERNGKVVELTPDQFETALETGQ